MELTPKHKSTSSSPAASHSALPSIDKIKPSTLNPSSSSSPPTLNAPGSSPKSTKAPTSPSDFAISAWASRSLAT
jgi:hypothetical protein